MSQVLALSIETMRARRGAMIGWTLALAATMALMVGIFPAMPDDFSKLAEQYPEDLLRAFGAESIGQMDTAIGYLKLELFGLVLPLAVAFLPMGVITRAVTGAEERRYLTPLLALPLARWKLIAAAAVAATASLLIGLGAIVLASLLVAWPLGIELGVRELAETTICLFPLSMTVAAVAALACGASGRHGLATAVGGGFLIVIYLLSLLAAFISELSWLADIGPWSYYSDWVSDGPVLWQLLAMTAIAYALIAAAALLFERRDVGG